MTTTDTITTEALRRAVSGAVHEPGDPGFGEAHAIFYRHLDAAPRVAVTTTTAEDVSAAVTFAVEHGLEIAVRSGGHSGAGHSTVEGGLVIDLSGLDTIDIDVAARTVTAGTGATAGQVTAAVGEHGLAIGFGDTGTVGIGGITTGGGVGFLSRAQGLTIDNVLAAQVVTADGAIHEVDAEHEPDLFWAIRGGGGNFGVVTRFRFKLHEVGTVVGGMLVLPATPEVIAGFIAECEAAPEELSAIANIMTAPPMPFLPAEYHGQRIIMGMLVYAGDIEAGQRAVAPFRALATPVADMVRPMPYPEIYPPEEEGYHPVAAARSLFINSVDRNVAQTILDHLQASTAQMSVTQLRVLGGAASRVPVEATAYAHRNSRIMVNVAALYQRPEEAAEHEAWASRFAEALNQGDTGVYVNFLGNEGEARDRDAYPGSTWDRLRQIKARYDPTNLFRLNHNIPPAS
jgi:FAD/FMN-containing dehydrogenase